jgi:hypothetical protein
LESLDSLDSLTSLDSLDSLDCVILLNKSNHLVCVLSIVFWIPQEFRIRGLQPLLETK